MIPGFDLVQFSQTAGPITALIVVAAIIFAESGLMIGFFFPGDSVLFTIGFLLSSGAFGGINVHAAAVLLYAAATIGYVVGYLFGKKIGPGLANRPNSRFFHQKNVQKAQEFYERHGGKTVILARFIPIVRTFVPLIAGVVKMPFKKFMSYNLVGGLLWIGGVTYGGYFLGFYLRKLGIDVDVILLPIVMVILLLSVSPAIYQLLKDKKQRQAIWDETKLQVKKLLNFRKRS